MKKLEELLAQRKNHRNDKRKTIKMVWPCM